MQITAVCNLQQTSQALSFGVAAAQLIPFTNQLFLALHDVLLRSVELPPNAGSVVHNLITVSTNANALVTLSAVVSSTRPGSLGTAVDGGTAYVSGTVLYTAVTTSDTGGTALFNLPLSSALLTPGRGAVVKAIHHLRHRRQRGRLPHQFPGTRNPPSAGDSGKGVDPRQQATGLLAG